MRDLNQNTVTTKKDSQWRIGMAFTNIEQAVRYGRSRGLTDDQVREAVENALKGPTPLVA